MSTYELGITSVDAITLYPNWNSKFGKSHIKSENRTPSGRLYTYKWADFVRFNIGLDYITNSSATVINSWWDSNAELLFFVTSGAVTEVHSVKIVNDQQPLDQHTKPYDIYWEGRIELEGY